MTQQFAIKGKRRGVRHDTGTPLRVFAPTVYGEVHVNTGDVDLDLEILGWLGDVHERIVQRIKAVTP